MMGKRSLKVGTPIWDWNGNMKKVEEIKVGDVVIGDDGRPRTVLDTLTGRSPLYKIKQSRGEDYVVSCEHILTLKFCGHAKIYWRKNQGKLGGWFMKWYDRPTKKVNSVKVSLTKDLTKEEAKSRIEALRERINLDPVVDIHVKDYLALSETDKRLMLGVKLNVPIEWRERSVPLDPRILGMWLGDGSKNRSVFTNEDKPLNDYFRNWCKEMGGEFTDWGDSLHHGITGCNFTQILKNNNLYKQVKKILKKAKLWEKREIFSKVVHHVTKGFFQEYWYMQKHWSRCFISDDGCHPKKSGQTWYNVLTAWFKEVPLKRFATTFEIAKSIAFLSSECSSFTTGSVLVIDGGQTRGYGL